MNALCKEGKKCLDLNFHNEQVEKRTMSIKNFVGLLRMCVYFDLILFKLNVSSSIMRFMN